MSDSTLAEPVEMPATTPAEDSAANTRTETTVRQADQRGWIDEIHTPEQTYNGNVPIDAIERDPGNRVPADTDIAKRAEEIQAVGLLQPIVLRDLGGGRYRIIVGETRWHAFKKLGRATIPAHIRAKEDGGEAGPSAGDVERRLIENLGRTDLNPVDQARGFRELCAKGRTQKEVGALFGLSQPVVANSIRMLALPEAVLEFIREGKLSGAHGTVLAKWSLWPKLATVIAELAIETRSSAKSLDAEDGVPFTYQLTRLGYVVSINTRNTWSGDRDPVYVVPKHLLERDDFVEESHCVYYLREPGTPDLWKPEKERQDKAREAKQKTEKAKHEKALASGKKTGDQIAREKKLAENRKLRAQIEATFEAGIDALKVAKDITPDMIAVLIEAALTDGRNANRIGNAANELQIKLAKRVKFTGDEEWKEHFGHYDLMAGGPLEAVKLTVAALLQRHHDDGLRVMSGMAPELRLIAQSAPPLTQQQWVERAAAKVGVTPAKFMIAAGCWQRDYTIADVRQITNIDQAKAKAIKALIEHDETLATICRNTHAAAEVVANKDPQRAAIAAKAKVKGGKK